MKIIGISSSATENRLFVNGAYVTAFTRPGIAPIILPIFPALNRETVTQDEYAAHHKDHIDALVERIDGYVASGGADINPTTFDEINWAATACDAERDMMELAMINACVLAGKPILGICRGHQIAGLYFGLSNFLQDLTATNELHAAADREMKDRMEPVHMIYVRGAFRDYLRTKTGRADLETMRTNSHHHQSFCLSSDGKIPKADLKRVRQWYTESIVAYEQANDIDILATTLKVIEAVEKPEAKYCGFQYHVEEAGPMGPSIQYWLDRYILPTA